MEVVFYLKYFWLLESSLNPEEMRCEVKGLIFEFSMY